jgi:hypothetical protein
MIVPGLRRLPPSVRESGEPIRFEQNFDGMPANIDADVLLSVRELPRRQSLLAVGQFQGSRQEAFLALAEILSRTRWTQESAGAFHQAIQMLWPGDPDLDAARTGTVRLVRSDLNTAA